MPEQIPPFRLTEYQQEVAENLRRDFPRFARFLQIQPLANTQSLPQGRVVPREGVNLPPPEESRQVEIRPRQNGRTAREVEMRQEIARRHMDMAARRLDVQILNQLQERVDQYLTDQMVYGSSVIRENENGISVPSTPHDHPNPWYEMTQEALDARFGPVQFMPSSSIGLTPETTPNTEIVMESSARGLADIERRVQRWLHPDERWIESTAGHVYIASPGAPPCRLDPNTGAREPLRRTPIGEVEMPANTHGDSTRNISLETLQRIHDNFVEMELGSQNTPATFNSTSEGDNDMPLQRRNPNSNPSPNTTVHTQTRSRASVQVRHEQSTGDTVIEIRLTPQQVRDMRERVHEAIADAMKSAAENIALGQASDLIGSINELRASRVLEGLL